MFCIFFFCNRDGMYVRVNGHLKIFQGSRQLGAFSVRYGSNSSIHFLLVISIYIYFVCGFIFHISDCEAAGDLLLILLDN